MPLVLDTRHCARCGRTTVHLSNGLNHAAHLILATVTAGLWLIVYAVRAATAQDTAYCVHCSAPQG